MIKRYKKRPVVVSAVKWWGDNFKEIQKLEEEGSKRHIKQHKNGTLTIKTLEGNIVAQEGDWIIKSVKGELYPCKPDIFKQTYQELGLSAVFE